MRANGGQCVVGARTSACTYSSGLTWCPPATMRQPWLCTVYTRCSLSSAYVARAVVKRSRGRASKQGDHCNVVGTHTTRLSHQAAAAYRCDAATTHGCWRAHLLRCVHLCRDTVLAHGGVFVYYGLLFARLFFDGDPQTLLCGVVRRSLEPCCGLMAKTPRATFGRVDNGSGRLPLGRLVSPSLLGLDPAESAESSDELQMIG